MSETAVLNSILRYLAWIPTAYVWRQNVGGMKDARGQYIKFGFPGMADIIGMFNGQFLAIECKYGKGKQTPAQLRFQQRVEEKGGIYLLAYSVDDVKKGLGL